MTEISAANNNLFNKYSKIIKSFEIFSNCLSVHQHPSADFRRREQRKKMMQVKLDEVRTEIETMMERACWRKEWRDQVSVWSKKIAVGFTKTDTASVVFPTYWGGGYRLIDWNKDMLTPKVRSLKHDKKSALAYCVSEARYLDLVPTNLMVDIFRHFVISFGGQFDIGSSASENYYRQYLYIDQENKHHDAIHKSLENIIDSTKTCADCDGWEVVFKQGIDLGGKLKPTNYIEPLARNLTHHQTTKMIEYQFRGSNKLQMAKSFFDLLSSLSNGINISHPKLFTPLIYPPDIKTIDAIGPVGLVGQDQINKREAMKVFNLDDKKDSRHNWNSIIANPVFVSILGDLTTIDVRFLIYCCIDAKYDREELIDKINRSHESADTHSRAYSGSNELEFPTANDHFSNFDFPHLRGTLSTTMLSRKLEGYARSMEEINTGHFAVTAPSALVNIVAAYYPVDVPHPATTNQ